MLVAISIPIFTSQLEKSRDAVTISNLRAAYAEAATEVLTNGTGTGSVEKDVVAKGTKDGLDGADDLPFDFKTATDKTEKLGGKSGSAATYTVKFTFADDKCTVESVTAKSGS